MNDLVYSTVPEEEEKTTEKTEQKKQRGPKYTPPATFRTPKNSSFSSWSKSIEAQVKHHKAIMEEANKCANIKGYKPTMKISKRFQHFFDQEVIEAQRRAKRKKKRKNKNDKKAQKAG